MKESRFGNCQLKKEVPARRTKQEEIGTIGHSSSEVSIVLAHTGTQPSATALFFMSPQVILHAWLGLLILVAAITWPLIQNFALPASNAPTISTANGSTMTLSYTNRLELFPFQTFILSKTSSFFKLTFLLDNFVIWALRFTSPVVLYRIQRRDRLFFFLEASVRSFPVQRRWYWYFPAMSMSRKRVISRNGIFFPTSKSSLFYFIEWKVSKEGD